MQFLSGVDTQTFADDVTKQQQSTAFLEGIETLAENFSARGRTLRACASAGLRLRLGVEPQGTAQCLYIGRTADAVERLRFRLPSVPRIP